MPHVPSSPVSPSSRRRHPSNLDLSAASHSSFAVNGSAQSPLQSPQTPRSPFPHSPTLRRRSTAGTMPKSARYSADFTAEADSGAGGLGNLADELANAWDEDEDDEEEEEIDVSGFQNAHDNGFSDHMGDNEDGSYIESMHDMGIGIGSGPSQRELESSPKTLQLPKQKSRQTQPRHRRNESMYDGSDYGNDSDFEDQGDLPPSLEVRIAGVEDLLRWSTGGNSSTSGAVESFIDNLRDLGGQSKIETNATRLITAHASLTSHLTHQTRSLQTLTHPLLFSPFPILSSDDIDDLIPLIDDLLPNLPFPVPQHQPSTQQPTQSSSTDPLLALQTLLSQTSDLTHALRALGDTIHESRQLTSTASRRLKSVRELVADMRREEESREEGTRWIEKGEWDRRLQEREAGRVCGDVVSGFEAVCGEWRARLFGAEVAAA
ncbi:hypothetical protein AJ80_04177 [Polytolypa hystricis UAMH7299]|uniref:Uncharacterized protein n=1 Tax=Polytolypa hystricis (strain UAMH7299) TaxID=1447883 RepID=A0A2B7YCE5_POLH7|nr:hypothetical protein AJ80_04177 [Polytolypa hystricis UAMH7299]